MPTFVNKANATGTTVSQLSISYAPTQGNTLLLGVLLQNGNAAVSGIFDNVGADIFGNPINAWQNLGTITLGTTRLELWGCLGVVTPPTTTTVLLTDVQAVVVLNLVEYSEVASFGQYGTASNTGYSNLFFNGTAENNQAIMVNMFAVADATGTSGSFVSGSGTINIPGQANYPITPAVIRQAVIGFGGGGTFDAFEQTVIIDPQLLVSEIVSTGIPVSGYLAVGVTLNGGFVLKTPPGFSDIDETNLVAGEVVHSLKLNQISQNASLGMVRPEFFYSTQVNGDTVDTPISPVDQYQYQRDELIYVYTPYTSFDPDTGWTGADGILFYLSWDVDPTTGAVTSVEYYHPSGNNPVNKSSDGQLIVLTIAQRANGGVKMDIPPGLSNVDLTKFGTDKPVTQTMMQTLAKNSKFAAVKAEVFYCGEFVNGQQVPPPVSAVDGYQYKYGECKFMSSWLWTTTPNSFSTPPMATADGGDAHGGWSQLNYLQAAVDSLGKVTTAVHFYNNGDIDPSTAPNGSTVFGRLRVFAFCQRNKGTYFGIPQLTTDSGNQVSTASIVLSVKAPEGSTTGNLTAAFKAASLAALNISKVVIKRTLAGNNSVIDTTNLLFSGVANKTVTAGTEATSDAVASWTFDEDHDYYLVVVYTGTFTYAPMQGVTNLTTPLISNVIGSDVSGSTTVTGLGIVNDPTTWRIISALTLTIVGDSVADEFFEIPITNFVPGQPLTAPTMTQLAQNVKEGSYAIEFFGPVNHVTGDTIPLPTSPTDGYTYSRKELLYIWQWHDTGNPIIRLFAMGASIDSAGLVSLMVWHCKNGGPPQQNQSGASIDVITIGVRGSVATSQTAPLNASTSNPPTDVASLAFGVVVGDVFNQGS